MEFSEKNHSKSGVPDINNDENTTDTEHNEASACEEKEEKNQNNDSSEHAYELQSKEISILKDQLLRALAEADNLRKRSKKEKDDILQYSIMSFARDIVLVKDNLHRALSNVSSLGDIENKNEKLTEEESFVKGIVITDKEFSNTLTKYKIKEINPIHTEFDCNLHQAMFEEESEEHAPNTVINVLQVGYQLKDKLLRPAMVSVAKKKKRE